MFQGFGLEFSGLKCHGFLQGLDDLSRDGRFPACGSPLKEMPLFSYSLNSLKGKLYRELYRPGTIIEVVKGDMRSVDYDSFDVCPLTSGARKYARSPTP